MGAAKTHLMELSAKLPVIDDDEFHFPPLMTISEVVVHIRHKAKIPYRYTRDTQSPQVSEIRR